MNFLKQQVNSALLYVPGILPVLSAVLAVDLLDVFSYLKIARSSFLHLRSKLGLTPGFPGTCTFLETKDWSVGRQDFRDPGMGGCMLRGLVGASLLSGTFRDLDATSFLGRW